MNKSQTNNPLSFERFTLVLQRFRVLHQRNFLIGFLCVAGFLFLLGTFPTISGMVNLTRSGFYAIQDTAMFLYVWGGLIFTSILFSELHTSTQAFQFLTLPATSTEKLFSAWLISSVLYTILAMSGIFLLSVIIETVRGINTGAWTSFYLFNPFRADIFQTILSYFFYESIFLLGAIYFQKNNFLKTLLTIAAIMMVLFVTANIAFLIFGLTQSDSFFVNIQLGTEAWHITVLRIISFCLMSFFLWLSYLQLKNKQVA